jgi:hypothetical protein
MGRFNFGFHIISAHENQGFFSVPQRGSPIPPELEAQ